MNLIEYKGYLGHVEYDPDDEILHGKVVNIDDMITFAADSPKEVKKAFEESVDEYMAYCKEQGGEPDKPYSGSFRLRMPRDVYQDVGYGAKVCDVSMNTFLVEEAEKAAKRVLRHAAKEAAASAKRGD